MDIKNNPQCGCPEWSGAIGMAEVTLHVQPNGIGEAFIFMGEWDEEKHFHCEGIQDLKRRVTEYINSLPDEK